MNKFLKYAVAICVMHSTVVCAEISTYKNLFNTKKEFALRVDIDNVQVGDLAYSATKCVSTDEYICLISDALVFSIPKDKNKNYWVHAGAMYKVIFSKEEWIRGELIKYRLIRQKWKKHTLEYVYSDDYGVLALKFNNDSALVLGEKCGFAAISSKYGCNK